MPEQTGATEQARLEDLTDLEAHLETARLKFLDIVEDIRPALHKYCARMTGSMLDGEDLVQETLAQAYYKLSMMKQDVPLRPWLFKIAHNKCVDFLRSRRIQFVSWEDWEDRDVQLNETSATALGTLEELEQHQAAAAAWSSLIAVLPPKERACVILKDILDHSLAEISDILDSPLTAVKAALHRGRHKLRNQVARVETPTKREESQLLARYIELFNRRDWEGVKQLLTANTQCEVVGYFSGRGRDAIAGNYLKTCDSLWPWKMAQASVDGEPVMVRWHTVDGHWQPRGLARLEWENGLVKHIRDYTHVAYLLDEIDLNDQRPT